MKRSVIRRPLLALPTLAALAIATLSCPFFAPRAQAAAREAAGASGPHRSAESRAEREQFDASGRPIYTAATGRRIYDDSGKPEAPAPLLAPDAGIAAFAARAAGPEAMAAASREWYRAIFGVGIGATGLNTADIDNDGTVEIVAAAGPFASWANNYWYVASRRGHHRAQPALPPRGRVARRGQPLERGGSRHCRTDEAEWR